MGLLRLLITDPVTFILLFIPLLYSIIIHEPAHGWVAYTMGDPTAKLLGRLSLNPLKHLEPVGTRMNGFDLKPDMLPGEYHAARVEGWILGVM